MTTSIGGTTGVTFPDLSVQPIAAGAYTFGFKNRIINGAMAIAQRDTSASPVTTGYYTVDRLRLGGTASVISSIAPTTAQSTNAPTGFVNSFLWTNTNAASPALTSLQAVILQQNIEGNNIADLAWGTASAATVTLSFWVRSSLTGTFGGSLTNSALDRSYPFSYTISAADIWEQKTVTIAGDTTGIWLTTNGVGLRLTFSLGVGTGFATTAGAWAAGTYYSVTGATDLVATSGATFYITGVQLEKGSTATSFDVRSYPTELMMCQRYYYRSTIGGSEVYGAGHCQATTSFRLFTPFPTTMRTSPTAVEQTGTAANYTVFVTGNTTCSSVPSFGSATEYAAATNFTVASGLTAGNGGQARSASAVTSYLGWSAEL
jgi:hypothetical protein